MEEKPKTTLFGYKTDEWEYYLNEVEANCPMFHDKAKMLYRILEQRTMPKEAKITTKQQYAIEDLIEFYLDNVDTKVMTTMIADAISDGEIEYD